MDFIRFCAYIHPDLPVLRRPAVCLVCTGNGKNKPHIFAAVPESQNILCCQRVKTPGTTAKKSAVPAVVCRSQFLFQAGMNIGQHFLLQHSVAREAGCGLRIKIIVHQFQSIFRTARNASLGTCTVPNWRIRFLPSFCFSSSFFFRVISPP